MKYPRLPESQDLRKKIFKSDEKVIRKLVRLKMMREDISFYGACASVAKLFNVTSFTIRYHISSDYRKQINEKNNKYDRDRRRVNYREHKKREILLRANRMKRNKKLVLWNQVVTANNEKRCRRKTVLGQSLDELNKN